MTNIGYHLEYHCKVVLLISVIVPTFAKAQYRQYRFFPLTQEDGLASYRVYDVAQDLRGFLWVGTMNGLNRYDGHDFKLYQHSENDSASLSENIARCLLVDKAGTVWVGTDGGGLNRFDRVRETFTRFVHNPNNPTGITEGGIRALYQDRSGAIWIGTLGGGLDNLVCLSETASTGESHGTPEGASSRTREVFTHFRHDPRNPKTLSNDRVYTILEDDAGTLWVGTDEGLNGFDRRSRTFTRFVHDQNNPHSLSSNLVRAIIQDRAGILWVGTESGGLNRFDKATGRFVHYRHSRLNSSISSDEVLSIIERSPATLWVGTVQGLNVFDKQSGTCVRLLHEPANPFSIPENRIRALRSDRTGVVWLATDQGLAKATPRTEQFKHYLLDPDYLKPQRVTSILESTQEEDVLWIGTGGGGLKRSNLKTGNLTTFKNDPSKPGSLPSDFVQSLFQDRKGTLWIGTYAGGLARYDHVTKEFPSYRWGPSTLGFAVMAMCMDTQGFLWVGTNGDGLLRFEPATSRFSHYRSDSKGPGNISSNNIFAIFEDTQRTLWIATEGGGLNKYDRENDRFTHYTHNPDDPHSISSDRAFVLHEDSQGRLWLSTSNGLNVLDRSTGKFELIHQADSGVTPYSTVIIEDIRSQFWLNPVEGGLCRFDPRSREFNRFDMSDGLQGQVFSRAGFRRRNGQLILGGMNGLNVFHPDSILTNRNIPTIVLTSFRVFDKPAVLDTAVSEVKTLTLNYNENYFSFEFAALDFNSPAKNKYAYRLEGLDKDWVYPEGRRFASYTNIDPGRYIFRVKGTNNDGIWNEAGVSLPITIKPPYWATWWFRGLVAAIVLATGIGAYNYRVAKLLEMERLRVRIASDLHDDIGSSLSGIALVTDSMRQHLPVSDHEREQLGDVSYAARHTADALRDIVWLVKPEHDGVDDIILRMKDSAARLLVGIEYSLHGNAQHTDIPLQMEFRRHLLLIYKEIVNNIAKHAHATKVDITFETFDRTFRLSIRDNGIGFDVATIRHGNGLDNLRRRTAEIGGTIRIVSNPGSGTLVEVEAEIV